MCTVICHYFKHTNRDNEKQVVENSNEGKTNGICATKKKKKLWKTNTMAKLSKSAATNQQSAKMCKSIWWQKGRRKNRQSEIFACFERHKMFKKLTNVTIKN